MGQYKRNAMEAEGKSEAAGDESDGGLDRLRRMTTACRFRRGIRYFKSNINQIT